MSFAQEIKDFLDAYDTVSTVFTNQDRTKLLERQTDIDERYKEAQIRKIDWDIGETGRENDAIVESIDDPYAPYRTSGTGTSGGGGGGGGAVALAGGSNTEMAMNYFVNQGLTPTQAAGLVGNLMAESGANLRTDAVGDAGTAIGIMQARGPRRDALEAAVPDWETNLGGQLDFIWAELNDPDRENKTLLRLQGANTPEEAAKAGIGYERPKGYTTKNPTKGHNYSGRLAYTRGLAQQYASLTPEGAVAELALESGTPAPEDFLAEDTPEWNAADAVTEGGENVISGRAGEHPLGIYDPDYVLWKEQGLAGGGGGVTPTDLAEGVIAEPVVEEPGAAQVPASAPPTAETMEAITEEPPAAGFDPLPQTTGYTDVVSREGSPDAAMEAMGDADPEPKAFVRDVISFGKKLFGIPEEGVDTEDSPQQAAMDDGIAAAPADLVQRIEERVDPDRTLTNEARMLKVMSVIWNFKMRQGKPNEAWGSAFSIYQTYKIMRDKSLGLAQAAAEEGDDTAAVKLFAEAYSLVPDGEVIAATPNEDGTWNIDVKDSQTGEVKNRVLDVDAKTIVSQIMNITPDQFDALVEEQILGGEPEQPDLLPGAIEEMYPEGEPSAPVPDEAIPETAPAPMGGTTIPPDQAQGPGIYEEGIQTASADPNAPVGDPTSTPLPTSTVTRPVQGAVPPPMDPKEFAKFLLKYPDEQTQATLTSLWKQDWAIYNEYIKTLPTEADVQSLAAYNKTFEEMRNTDNETIFDIDQSSIAGVKDNDQQTQLRLIAEAHNKRANEILQARKDQLAQTEEYKSTETAANYIDRLPRDTAFFAPLKAEEVPGYLGDPSDENWGPMYGGAIEADPARIYGADPVRGPEIYGVTGDELRNLSTEDRTFVTSETEAARKRTADWNARLGPRAPLPTGEDETTLQTELAGFYNAHVGVDNTTEQVAGVIDSNENPMMAELAKFMRDDAANTGKNREVLTAARVMLDVTGNKIEKQDAVAAAWAMMSFNPYQPTESLFYGVRADPSLGMPADVIGVYRLDEPQEDQIPVYIPEDMFMVLDQNRQDLADKWIEAHRYMSTVNGQPVDLSTVEELNVPRQPGTTPEGGTQPEQTFERELTPAQEAYRKRREELGIPIDPDAPLLPSYDPNRNWDTPVIWGK